MTVRTSTSNRMWVIAACGGLAAAIGLGASPAAGSTWAREDLPGADEQHSGGPEASAVRGDAAALLRSSVRAARAYYKAEVKVARAQYDLSLTPARTNLRAALAGSATKVERAAAIADFQAAKKAAANALESAVAAAAAKRDAAIDSALAEYLVATGKSAVLEALEVYRNNAKMAAATLELALNSARAAYKTDTSDEREQLSDETGAATTAAERALAWARFEAATIDEQEAFRASVNSARATYRSALKKARSQFREATGMSTKRLAQLPFNI